MKLPRNGFSLVELLVVLAVLGILSALVLTGLQSVRSSGEKVTSVSNLRNIGMAIQSYANENGFKLPGPLYSGQQSRYRSSSNGLLGYYLWPYLDGEKPDNTWRDLDALATPFFIENRPSDDGVAFLAQRTVRLPGQPGRQPFGYPKAQGNNPIQQPLSMQDIQAYDLEEYWALQEVDALHPDISGWDTTKYLPEPAHGDVRLTLYFDWSVGEVPVNEGTVQ